MVTVMPDFPALSLLTVIRAVAIASIYQFSHLWVDAIHLQSRLPYAHQIYWVEPESDAPNLIMLRSTCKRDTFAWKPGETKASARKLMALSELTARR